MTRIEPPADTTEPWLEYLPPNASSEMIDFAKTAWTQGYRPTWDSANGQWQWNTQNRTRTPAGVPIPGGGPPSAGGGGSYSVSPEAPPGTPQTPATVSPATQDLVLQDPEWLARIGGFDQRTHDQIVNYGSAAGVPQVDAATAAAAAANPHSVLAMLGQMRQQNDIGLSNQAQMHHATMSGANLQTHINEASSDETRRADAARTQQNNLLGVANDRDALYWSIFHRIAANPPQVTPTPGNPGTAGPALPNSLPVAGNTSDAGGVRTIGDQRYIVQNPQVDNGEKRPYQLPYPKPTAKPKRPRTPGSGL